MGDPNQAIYSWNGADPGLLHNFADKHPGATVVRLGRNYRSSPEVAAVAASVLGTTADAVGGGGPVPSVHTFGDDAEEAAGIVAILRRAHGRWRWSDAAVLVRTHTRRAS